MSDRSGPGLTAIATIMIVVIAGCAGSPEPAPAPNTAPAPERVDSVVTEEGAHGEDGPDTGIGRVTPATPEIEVSVPLPEIELNEAFQTGRVDPGFFVAAPESSPDQVIPLDEPELPSAGMSDATGNAGLPGGLAIAVAPEPTTESGTDDASEPAVEPEPPAESGSPAESGPAGRSAPWSEAEPIGPAVVTTGPPSRPEPAEETAEEPRPGDALEPVSPEAAVDSAGSGVPETPEGPVAVSPSPSPEPGPVQERTFAAENRVPRGREPARERPGAQPEPEEVTPSVAAPPVSGPRFTETPETTRNTRTVAPASEIEVRLPGVSWLFLGSEPPVTFLGRETDPAADETLFRFRVTEAAELRFEAQDLASGDRTRHEETVEIAASDFDETATAVGIGDEDRNTRSGQTTETPRRSEANSTDEVTQPADGNTGPDGADELTYLEYLQDPDQTFDPDHHASIVTAITEGDTALRDVPPAVLISYADRLRDGGEPSAARDVLQAMWDFSRMRSDEVLYRLARLAERDGPTRDLRRARELYASLVDLYPFSVHYRDSEERIRFLNRHFFHIR